MDALIPSVRPKTEQHEELIGVLDRQDGLKVVAAGGSPANHYVNVGLDDDARWSKQHTDMALQRGFIVSSMRDDDGGEVQLRNLRMEAGGH